MKKLLFIILIVFAFSCEKETCKTCTTTMTQTGGGFASQVVSTTTFDACGETLISVDGKTIVSRSGSITVTSKTTCR